ncbi:hypothetical protein [Lacipirellula sp.]|uniref:hypothetical protein n=1 Tax=Lacipirellula sp. TaxID=2691419 RepID=UPI003D14C845
MQRVLWVAVVLFSVASLPAAAELPDAATILDGDIAWDVANVDSFSISPDGQQVAYISGGALWACSLTQGPPKKLVDLPQSITAYLVMPGNELIREQAAGMPPTPSYRPINGISQAVVMVFNVAWSATGDGIYYTRRTGLKQNSTLASFKVTLVSLDGKVREIADIHREFAVDHESQISFRVSRDASSVVASNHGIPLIWDAAKNKPRATCFDYLTPSTSSGRWLGVEIDSRELVLADENLAIVRRFEVFLPQQRRCELTWSSDERYAVCLSHLEHPSDKTEGVRVDLQTGTQTQLNPGVIRDQFYFTGRGGELVRLGITGIPPKGLGDGSYGAYISMLPDGDTKETDVIRFAGPPRTPTAWRDQRPYPAILGNDDGTLFAIALPRPVSQAAGFHYHLVDHNGQTWPFLPKIDSPYITPFYPLAFIDEGQAILARDGKTLFTLPVSSIQQAAGDDR